MLDPLCSEPINDLFVVSGLGPGPDDECHLSHEDDLLAIRSVSLPLSIPLQQQPRSVSFLDQIGISNVSRRSLLGLSHLTNLLRGNGVPLRNQEYNVAFAEKDHSLKRQRFGRKEARTD